MADADLNASGASAAPPPDATAPDAPSPYAPPASRSGAARLEAALRNDPTSFTFFQAVRLLGRLHPSRQAVGGWADPSEEVARFSGSTALSFPPSELEAMTLPEDPSTPTQIRVAFLGLTGPQGVLPQSYTEHASRRARAKDTAFRDFLDLFHHRILSLFYAAWERGHPAIAAERGREDRMLAHLLDLVGLGTPGHRGRLPVRDEALAYYAGLFAPRTRPADGLARLVGDYFDVPALVEQFVGEWRRVDALGQSTLEDGDAGRLGFGVLGDAAWDPQARVRLRLGPLTRARFDAFLPGGAHHGELRALARLYADEQVGVDAQLVLAREAVTPCVLAVPQPASGAEPSPRLGRGSWLASRAMQREPDDTVLILC